MFFRMPLANALGTSTWMEGDDKFRDGAMTQLHGGPKVAFDSVVRHQGFFQGRFEQGIRISFVRRLRESASIVQAI